MKKALHQPLHQSKRGNLSNPRSEMLDSAHSKNSLGGQLERLTANFGQEKPVTRSRANLPSNSKSEMNINHNTVMRSQGQG